MPDTPDLSPTESALLIVLMVEARPVSNNELSDRFKLTLTGKTRVKLNGMKYVESWKEGRQYVHQLGDAGWARCRGELNFDSSGGRAVGAALTTLLRGIRRYLDSADRSLADLFAPEAAGADNTDPDPDLTGRIRALYSELAPAAGRWVSLADLRNRLDGHPRTDVDAALRRLERSPDVNIVPQSNQKALTAADRGSAVRIGGQEKHFLAIGV